MVLVKISIVSSSGAGKIRWVTVESGAQATADGVDLARYCGMHLGGRWHIPAGETWSALVHSYICLLFDSSRFTLCLW